MSLLNRIVELAMPTSQEMETGILQVLVLELVTVDRLSTGTVVVGEVTTLAHELGDDAVEARALEAEALLPSA